MSVSTAQILWENRLIGDLGTPAKTSFDGVHFKTKEPRPDGSFWNGHYSHKFKSSGLSYLVGLSIQTGHIVVPKMKWQKRPDPPAGGVSPKERSPVEG